MEWTQPICVLCWIERKGGVLPVRVVGEHAQAEKCCYCGLQTTYGVYIRVDPRTVPHPRGGAE